MVPDPVRYEGEGRHRAGCNDEMEHCHGQAQHPTSRMPLRRDLQLRKRLHLPVGRPGCVASSEGAAQP